MIVITKLPNSIFSSKSGRGGGVMRRLRAAGAFLVDFVIGEDPWVAVVVVAALGLTALAAAGGLAAWWIVPMAVAAGLTLSVLRAARAP